MKSTKHLYRLVVLLSSRVTAVGNKIDHRHRRLAEVVEMISVANSTRAIETYSIHLDSITLEVADLISTAMDESDEAIILEDVQRFDSNLSFNNYFYRCFCKGTSLLANGAMAASALNESSEEIRQALYKYGRYLGTAIQIKQDLESLLEEQFFPLKEINGLKLRCGYISAAVLFALEEFPSAAKLIQRHFSQDGDFEVMNFYIRESQGIARSKDLVSYNVTKAVQALEILAPTWSRQALINIALTLNK